MALYSETVNETIRRAVSLIDHGGITHIRSHMFTFPAGGAVEWRDAKYEALSGTWYLRDSRAFSNDDGPRDLKTSVKYGLCFFDALYEIALFEQAAIDRPVIDPPRWPLEGIHIREAARALHIPYDMHDMPLPVVNGDIPVAGSYTHEAAMLAAKAKNNLRLRGSDSAPRTGAALVSASAQTSLQTLGKNLGKPASRLKSDRALRDLFCHAYRCVDGADRMGYTLKNRVLSLMSLETATPYECASFGSDYLHSAFKGMLPSDPRYTETEALIRDVPMLFAAVDARIAFMRASTSKKPSVPERALRTFEKRVSRLSLTDEQKSILHALIISPDGGNEKLTGWKKEVVGRALELYSKSPLR